MITHPWLLYFVLIFSAKAWAEPFVIPPLTSPVMDGAQVVEAHVAQKLNQVLRQVFEAGGPQITVLTTPTLGSDVLEDISIKIVDQWKLGRKGKDDGILMIVVPNDRKMRIEVGRGLEGVVTDAMSKRIIREVMSPSFRQNNYSQGIYDGVVALLELSYPEFDVSVMGVSSSRKMNSGGSEGLSRSAARGFLTVFFVGLFIIIAIFRKILSVLGLIPRSGFSGGRHWSSGSGFGSGGSGWGGGGSGSGWGGGGGGFSGGGSSGSW